MMRQKTLRTWVVPPFEGILRGEIFIAISEDKQWWYAVDSDSYLAEAFPSVGKEHTWVCSMSKPHYQSCWEVVRQYIIEHLLPTLESSPGEEKRDRFQLLELV